MSAFLYTFHRELFCLNVDDYKVENGLHLKQIASKCCGGIPENELSVIHNGHLISEESKLHLQAGDVCYTNLCLLGGKGGFGSMLRAIGAQIEKTTSREACRDLSGRRMRDINDEKKIADWVSKQAERERDKERQKQERMERKRMTPKHTFDDASYTKHIQENSERIEDALQQGLKAAGSSGSTASSSTSTEKTTGKRVHSDEPSTSRGSKKSKTWLGMDDLNSDEDEEEFAVSANSSFTPSTFPLTVTSCTSTQVEPSTSNESLDNTCRMDDILETVSPPKASETQTAKDDFGKDTTTVVQDEVKLSQTTSKEDMHTEGRCSASADKDTEKESCEKAEFCLEDYTSAQELESVGLERLKEELMARGLKCGGALQQRAQRLFATKGVSLDQLDPSFFPKPTGSKKSNGKK